MFQPIKSATLWHAVLNIYLVLKSQHTSTVTKITEWVIWDATKTSLGLYGDGFWPLTKLPMALVAFRQLQTVFTVHSMSVGMAKTNTIWSYAYTQLALTSRGSIQKDFLFTASIVGVDPTQTWRTCFHFVNWSVVTKHTGSSESTARSLC